MDFFERVPKGVLVLMITVSLALNVFSFGYSQAGDNQTHNDIVAVCKTYAPTTHAVNSVHTLFHDLIENSLKSTLKRIGTPKELPSDKANLTKYQKYINKFILVSDVKCGKVVK